MDSNTLICRIANIATVTTAPPTLYLTIDPLKKISTAVVPNIDAVSLSEPLSRVLVVVKDGVQQRIITGDVTQHSRERPALGSTLRVQFPGPPNQTDTASSGSQVRSSAALWQVGVAKSQRNGRCLHSLQQHLVRAALAREQRVCHRCHVQMGVFPGHRGAPGGMSAQPKHTQRQSTKTIEVLWWRHSPRRPVCAATRRLHPHQSRLHSRLCRKQSHNQHAVGAPQHNTHPRTKGGIGARGLEATQARAASASLQSQPRPTLCPGPQDGV